MPEVSIGVALIANDCLEQLQKLLPQLEKFDQVVIGWNGSDPKVKKYLDKLSTPAKSPYEYFKFDWRPSGKKIKTVYPFGKDGADPLDQYPIPDEYYGLNEWGFSYARNLTFDKIKTTHVLWLDTDDLIGFVKDGRDIVVTADQAYRAFKKIATEAPEDVDVWFSNYIYSRDANNNPNVVHARERMLKDPHRWKWVYPIHEVLVPDREPKWAMIKDVQTIHYPPQKVESSADRNLRMLEEWKTQLEQEGSKHDLGRCLLYIGDTYWALQEWKKAASTLLDFIKNHPDSLDVEKWQAWCFIAKCQIELNNFDAGQAAALAAIGIEPGLPDGYILLAQCKLLTDQDPQDILVLLDTAGRMDDVPPQIIQNPLDYTFTPYCIVSRCKFLLGQYDSALEWAIKAQNLCPMDARTEALRVDAASKVRERDAVNAAKALYQLYKDFDENEKAEQLYSILPYVAQQSQDVIEDATLAKSRVRHLKDREEYIKLYSENSRWQPAHEEDLDEGLIMGEDRFQYILSRLHATVPIGGTILDVGCSDGFHSLLYAKAGYKVVGVDLDKRCVDLANERAEKRGLSAVFVHGFFEEMDPEKQYDPFETQRYFDDPQSAHNANPSTWFHHFDAVVCSEVIEHVPDPGFLIGALSDCAKDGAPILITTPDGAYDKGDIPPEMGMDHEDLAGHVRVFTQDSLERLLKSDLDFNLVESHFLQSSQAYRDHQGWQVGEIRRQPRPNGPIIRVYCGPNVKFSPGDLERTAGSELAVINMAKHWASAGCQVVVYGGENGVYDGVFYRDCQSYSPEHYSDIYISWRLVDAFADQRPNAKKTVLWCHDLYFPGDVPQEWVDRIDTIAVLSKFHEDYITGINKNFQGKTWITRNGLDPARYTGKNIEKKAHKYFYTSDFGRGLEELLDVWPSIKEAIPDAELHVAYRLATTEFICKLQSNKEPLKKTYRLISRMEAMNGVTYYEALGPDEVADLQLSCEAWLYPPQPSNPNGGFLETYCIVALEAQAARCYPFSRVNGALIETIKHQLNDWNPELTVEQVIRTLNWVHDCWDDPVLKEYLDRNQKWTLSQTWKSLAIDWLKEFAPKE